MAKDGVNTRLSDAQRRERYGDPCKGPMVRLATPWGLWITLHELVVPDFLRACGLAHRYSSWTPKRIDSLACRKIRGSSAWSLHAYGLAWDFFATKPGVTPPGGVWTPDNGLERVFAECFENVGFTWGGRWQRKDVPHIEWARAPREHLAAPD